MSSSSFKFFFLPTIPIPSFTAIKDTIGDTIGYRLMLRTRTPLTEFYPDPHAGIEDPEYFAATHDNATLVISKLADSDMHMPVIDIDLPCMLVPSSKPGHFHLYINRAMTWSKYVAILEALEAAGVIQEGYLHHSKRRGYTTVRYPGVTKQNELERIEDTEDSEVPF